MPEQPKNPHAGAAPDLEPLNGGFGYGGESQVEGGTFHDYLRVLYRRRWPAATVFLVILTALMLSSARQVTLYEGRTQLLIEVDAPNVVNFTPLTQQNNYWADFYPTQHKILQSRALAKKTIDALKLWNHPEFAGPRPQAAAATSFNPITTIRQWVKAIVPSGLFGSEPSVPTEADLAQRQADERTLTEATEAGVLETPDQARAINGFLGGLTIAPVRESRLVDIKFRSTSPVLAATAANGLAKAYIDQTLDFQFDTSKGATDWLSQRLAEQRSLVEASELALQQFREQSGAVAFDGDQNIVIQKLAGLNEAVTKAKTDRLAKEAVFRQIEQAGGNSQVLEALPVVVSNSVVQQIKLDLGNLQRQQAQMSERLGEKHADMIKITSEIASTQQKLQSEIGRAVAAARNDYEAAVAQEESLAAALAAQNRDALSLNRSAITYAALEREAESNRQIYNTLLQRAKETGVAEHLNTSNVRVVDYAQVPRSPVFPDRKQDLLIAICAGLIGALGVAFFFEFMDNRIKTPDEIKNKLGLTYLGLLPTISKKSIGDKHPMINNGVPATFSESFRHVRTSVLFSLVDEGPKSVLITSTGPGEGKTCVSTNLAIALSQAGHRVLIVDADMRRPKVHGVFDEKQEPGLSNVLAGNAKPSTAIVKTSVPNLWLLPAGHTPPNPAELLGSKRFHDLFTHLLETFDWVIVDSPPLLAVTDASMIAGLTGGVVFVIGSEMTSRQAAQHALERLTATGAHVLGGVLNRANLSTHSYYYSKYYNRKYESYYSDTAH